MATQTGRVNLIHLGQGVVPPNAATVVALTNNSTDSTPDDTVAAGGAVIVSTITDFTATATGSGVDITSADAGDLTFTSAALEVLRDVTQALVVALNARFVVLDSNISDCTGKLNEVLTLLQDMGIRN